MQLELPYAAIGLVWNSMMSVAGGWFFLMACEMFVLGTRDFRLPGLGSYLQTAANAGDTQAILWGVATMIAVIVLLDQIRLAAGHRVGREVQDGASGEHRRSAVVVSRSDRTIEAAGADAQARVPPGERTAEPLLRAQHEADRPDVAPPAWKSGPAG